MKPKAPIQPPNEVWVSWCARCGNPIIAHHTKALTDCPTCPYPGGRVRYARYVRKRPA